MTQSEFTQRTKVAVDNEEFFAIHEVYVASDLDKDAFCKMWCKMNKSRVQAAKEKNKAAEFEAKKRNYLYKFLEQEFDITEPIVTYVSYNDSKKFFEYGFDVTEVDQYTGVHRFKTISRFLNEIRSYLKIAR